MSLLKIIYSLVKTNLPFYSIYIIVSNSQILIKLANFIMKEEEGNIFTVFDDLINRNEKELLLNQKSKVIWMTGLSGSGKTTIAKALEKKLHLNNIISQLHDGDNIRVGISNNLSFSSEDRLENIRRISEISKLFLNCGIVTLNCFISPTNEIRQIAKDIIGENDFIEIYINASLKICEDRDVKGLYKKARNGEIKNFTGISATYEEPKQPNLVINTTLLSIEESVKKIYDYILPLIKNK